MGKGKGRKKVFIFINMIRGSRDMCKASRDITSLDNRSNVGRFGCLSETKVLLIFTECKNDTLRCGCAPLNKLELAE